MIQVLQGPQVEHLRRFLGREPVSGLFLLGLLEPRGIESAPGRFYGVSPAGGPGAAELSAVAYLGDGGLLVPEGEDPEALEQLAEALARSWRRVRVVVGPREPTDLIWQRCFRWGEEPAPRLWRQHLLYRLEPADLAPGPEEEGLRLAEPADLDELVTSSAAMRLEELGDDVLRSNPLAFRQRVYDRICARVSWIVRDERGIAFKTDIGTHCRHGVQLEGVYTRPDRRGAHLAVRSLRRLCRQLLQEVPRVTLHVWDQNLPAVHCYERLGFVAHSPYRVVLR